MANRETNSSGFMRRALWTLGLGACSTACNLIPVQINTSTDLPNSEGKIEHRETHWEGTLDQLPEGLAVAGNELSNVTGKLLTELIDVPPPGKVTLGDLGLGQFQGRADADFLMGAKGDDGKPLDFTYVRLGVASYDDFFEQAQVVHALCVQTLATVQRMTRLSSQILHEKVNADAKLQLAVSRALKADASAKVEGALVVNLQTMGELGASLVTLSTQLVAQSTRLVTTGQALIAGAQASLTNPKVITHIPLIKDGLVASISVIAQSVKVVPDLVVALGGAASADATAAITRSDRRAAGEMLAATDLRL